MKVLRRQLTVALLFGLTFLGCKAETVRRSVQLADLSLPDVGVQPGRLFRGVFSPHGDAFYYFARISDDEEDYRIYWTVHTDSGWSQSTPLFLGDSGASNMYPAISPDGELLVFSSYRSVRGESGNANLWVARRQGAGWAEPELLRATSTLENYDAAPWFAPGGDLHFTSTSPDWTETWMRKSTRLDEGFGPWSEDEFWDALGWPRETHHFWSGVLNSAGTIAVIELSPLLADGGFGDADLWIARNVEGDWSVPEPMGSSVNTGGTENFATFAPDDSTIVFVRDFSEFHLAVPRSAEQ